MKNIMQTLLIMVAMCILASPGSADQGWAGKGKMGMKTSRMKMAMYEKMGLEDKFHMKMMLILANTEDLALTEDQIDKIKVLKYNLKKKKILNKAEIETLTLDIMDALGKDKVDTDAAKAFLDNKYELKKQMAKDLVDAYIDLGLILTPEQQKKVKDIWEKKLMGKIKMMMGESMTCPMKHKMKQSNKMMEKKPGAPMKERAK